MNYIDHAAVKQAVYEIVRMIPRGRATSYGAIAKAIGYPNQSRLVGRIMSQAANESEAVPAHRVVNSQGILSAKAAFGPANQMHQLLEAEGITIINDKIQHWEKVFWNPLDEILL